MACLTCNSNSRCPGPIPLVEYDCTHGFTATNFDMVNDKMFFMGAPACSPVPCEIDYNGFLPTSQTNIEGLTYVERYVTSAQTCVFIKDIDLTPPVINNALLTCGTDTPTIDLLSFNLIKGSGPLVVSCPECGITGTTINGMNYNESPYNLQFYCNLTVTGSELNPVTGTVTVFNPLTNCSATANFAITCTEPCLNTPDLQIMCNDDCQYQRVFEMLPLESFAQIGNIVVYYTSGETVVSAAQLIGQSLVCPATTLISNLQDFMNLYYPGTSVYCKSGSGDDLRDRLYITMPCCIDIPSDYIKFQSYSGENPVFLNVTDLGLLSCLQIRQLNSPNYAHSCCTRFEPIRTGNVYNVSSDTIYYTCTTGDTLGVSPVWEVYVSGYVESCKGTQRLWFRREVTYTDNCRSFVEYYDIIATQNSFIERNENRVRSNGMLELQNNSLSYIIPSGTTFNLNWTLLGSAPLFYNGTNCTINSGGTLLTVTSDIEPREIFNFIFTYNNLNRLSQTVTLEITSNDIDLLYSPTIITLNM